MTNETFKPNPDLFSYRKLTFSTLRNAVGGERVNINVGVINYQLHIHTYNGTNGNSK